MDPITLAIISAISSGVVSGTTEVVLTDLYTKLKNLLKQKYGENSNVLKAVVRLEKDSASDSRKNILEKEIAAVQAGEDLQLVNEAKTLLKELNLQDANIHNSQVAKGRNIYQANNNSQITINGSRSRKKGHVR